MNAFRRVGRGEPLKIIAHRGDSSHAPENTIEAAVLAHSEGAFAWELDVHLSRDGVPVVIHDETLIRTTDVAARFAGDGRARSGFRVADFTWEEIRSLDAGSWFVEPSGRHRSAVAFGTLAALPESIRRVIESKSVCVPSLIAALDLTRSLDWRVNVELKSMPDADSGLLPEVLAAIDRTGTMARVLLSSFDHDEAALAAKARPEIAVGILSDAPIHRPAEYAKGIVGVDFYHPSASACGAESRAYRRSPGPSSLRAIDPGIPTWVYTVNDPALAAHLADIGAAGVFTDDPSGLLESRAAIGDREGQAGGSIRSAHQTPLG